MLDAMHLGEEHCTAVRDRLGDYSRWLSTHEWRDGWVELEPAVSHVLKRLVRAIAAAEAAAANGSHLRRALLNGQTELRKLRTDGYFHPARRSRRASMDGPAIPRYPGADQPSALHVGRRPQLVLSPAIFSFALQ